MPDVDRTGFDRGLPESVCDICNVADVLAEAARRL